VCVGVAAVKVKSTGLILKLFSPFLGMIASFLAEKSAIFGLRKTIFLIWQISYRALPLPSSGEIIKPGKY
jgi:hypothetical protein